MVEVTAPIAGAGSDNSGAAPVVADGGSAPGRARPQAGLAGNSTGNQHEVRTFNGLVVQQEQTQNQVAQQQILQQQMGQHQQ